jgi:hypothetical protein
MGFYECVHDCGDNCYCVSIGSSLDNFESTSWIFCEKHKDPKNRKTYYDLTNFTRKFSNKMTRQKIMADTVSIKSNARGIILVKLELKMNEGQFGRLELKESKKLYFSEFDDEPSWRITNNKIYIIDALSQFNEESVVDSPPCRDPNIIFNWSTNKVMTIDEYNEWYKKRESNNVD